MTPSRGSTGAREPRQGCKAAASGRPSDGGCDGDFLTYWPNVRARPDEKIQRCSCPRLRVLSTRTGHRHAVGCSMEAGGVPARAVPGNAGGDEVVKDLILGAARV
jgi:hypothetical protein